MSGLQHTETVAYVAVSRSASGIMRDAVHLMPRKRTWRRLLYAFAIWWCITPRGVDAVESGTARFSNPFDFLAALLMSARTATYIDGRCTAGHVYRITSYADVLQQTSDLECIFASAYVPDRVPVGLLYGNMVLFGNTQLFNPFINNHYQGDFVYETRCQGEQLYLGTVQFDGITVGVGQMKLAPYKDAAEIAPFEFFDRRNGSADGLIYEFDEDLYRRCHITPPWPSSLRDDLLMDTYPTRVFTDILRAVGRAPDGALILLGRTFLRDPAHPTARRHTVYYFILRTYDPEVLSNLSPGFALPPLAQASSFAYRRVGYFQTLLAANPLAYFMGIIRGTDPSTLLRIVQLLAAAARTA